MAVQPAGTPTWTGQTTTTTHEFNVTIDAGATDTGVAVQVYVGDVEGECLSVTVGGVSATRVAYGGSDPANDYRSEQWIVTGLAPGTHQVVSTWTPDANDKWTSARPIQGVDQSNPVRDFAAQRINMGSTSTQTISATVDSDVDDLVLDCLADNSSGGDNYTPQSGQTVLLSPSVSDTLLLGQLSGASPTVESEWLRENVTYSTATSQVLVSYQPPASTGATLAVDDATHGHAADSPSLTQAHMLAVNDAAHDHLAESPTLTEAAQLAVDSTLHAHAAGSPTLAQAHVLTVAGAVHGHSVDEPALVQAHVLSVEDALHGHSAEAVTLDLSTVLSVDEALHAHSADTLSLTQAHVLVVEDAQHNHAAEQVALTQSIILSPADARHGHVAEAPELTQAYLLAIQDALHAHAADEPAVLAGGVLVVSDALHAHLADNLIFPGTVFQAGRLMVVRGFDRVMVVAPSDRLAVVGPFDRVTVVKH